MSNYYTNSIRLSDIIQYDTNGIVKSKFSGLSITTKTDYSGFNSSYINEQIQTGTGYNYSGTDISSYCIAAYTESASGNFSSSSIPSWCNKIRAVLIGGGGGGASTYNNDQNVHQNYDSNQHQHYDSNYHYNYDYNQHYNYDSNVHDNHNQHDNHHGQESRWYRGNDQNHDQNHNNDQNVHQHNDQNTHQHKIKMVIIIMIKMLMLTKM